MDLLVPDLHQRKNLEFSSKGGFDLEEHEGGGKLSNHIPVILNIKTTVYLPFDIHASYTLDILQLY